MHSGLSHVFAMSFRTTGVKMIKKNMKNACITGKVCMIDSRLSGVVVHDLIDLLFRPTRR